MWYRMSAPLFSFFRLSLASFQSFCSLCFNLPKTVHNLWFSASSRYFLRQSFIVNTVYFALPLFMGRAILENLRLEPEKEAERAIVHALLSPFYFIFMFRLKLLNFALHHLGILLSVSWLRPSLERLTLSFDGLCKQCKLDGSRFVSELALIKHYFIGEFAVSYLASILQKIPGIGDMFELMLRGYWKSFILFQYPLAAKRICADHQVALLLAHKPQLIGFGFFALGLEKGVMKLLLWYIPDELNQKILKTALLQILDCFEIVHAYQHSDWIKQDDMLNTTVQRNKLSCDPIILTWQGSLWSSRYLLKALNQSGSSTAMPLSAVIDAKIKTALVLKNKLTHSFLYPLIFFSKALFIPQSLRSFQDFIDLRPAQPLIYLFFEELQPLLKLLEQMNENFLVKSCCRLLAFPLLGTIGLGFAARYVHLKIGLNEKWVKDLGQLLQSSTFREHLKSLYGMLLAYQYQSQTITFSFKSEEDRALLKLEDKTLIKPEDNASIKLKEKVLIKSFFIKKKERFFSSPTVALNTFVVPNTFAATLNSFECIEEEQSFERRSFVDYLRIETIGEAREVVIEAEKRRSTQAALSPISDPKENEWEEISDSETSRSLPEEDWEVVDEFHFK